jgi:DNA polymerase-2
VETRWRPCLHINEDDRERVIGLLGNTPYRIGPSSLQSFSGTETLFRLDFPGYAARSAAVRLLENAGISGPDTDTKPADQFLIEKCIRGPVEISGEAKPGRRVDLVFTNPELAPLEKGTGEWPLKIASIDIETDTRSGAILAVAISIASGADLNKPDIIPHEGLVRVLSKNFTTELHRVSQRKIKILKLCETLCSSVVDSSVPIFHQDEASLLRAFIDDISRTDPDVLTGWNFLDFDFPRLAERCRHYHIPFAWGRAGEGAKFFPGEGRRSAAAHVPGRQVIDALRIVRSGPSSYINVGTGGSYTLENVARTVLGEGKLVSSSGEDKLAELERLYREDPVAFGEYCFQDACLVPRILAKTGLWRLTLERATLTGVTLDKAWTSVVSFERIYAMELGRRGIAPPAAKNIEVSGAAGGTVLESVQGLFSNIAVFDFRSLYPTIMLTFNIDPLAHKRAGSENSVIAPNGAAFSREPGPLPALIAEYFAARKRAISAGDATAAQVYKILMNSFYGVLGSSACRYGRTELAGAITSFARKWLLFSRDWFSKKGLRVLYGDTDSLFVETGFCDEAG